MYEAAEQCWHPGMNTLLLNSTCSLLMLWITWCLLLFSIHKFILPNYTSHSCTVLTFSLRLSLCCLFLLLLKGLCDPFLLSVITTESICLVQTNTEWSHTQGCYSIIRSVCPESLFFPFFLFNFFSFWENTVCKDGKKKCYSVRHE